jgi:CheY-like chemotaxis protein
MAIPMSTNHSQSPFILAIAAAAGPPDFAQPGSDEGVPQAALQGRSVLVVEDESLIALLIADALEESGARVVGPCFTLAECFRVAREEQIDAAVLDVDLGGEDVFPAAEELRRRGVPFVFHTAHADREELQERFGDVAVCRKPVDKEELIERVAALAEHRPIN